MTTPPLVVITGAGTGLGRATALHLAQRGMRVYATVPTLDQAPALAAAAQAAGVSLEIVQLDVTDQGSIDAAHRQIIAEDTPFALINNAAIALRVYFEDLLPEEIERAFEVNVLGTMKVIRTFLPEMRRARRGRLLIITSVGGRIASLGVSGYCATKFAQEGMAECLQQELKPFGIDVVIVEPAIIATERFGANRGYAANAFDPQSPYHDRFRASQRLTDRLVASSPTTAQDVALAIEAALTTKRPKLRYAVGRRARVVLAARRLLPAPLFDRLYFGEAMRRVTAEAKQLESA